VSLDKAFALIEGHPQKESKGKIKSLSHLPARGVQHLYIDGGITIQGFLGAGAIHRLIITRVPVLIGDGVPLFGALPRDIRLRHVATCHYPSGLVQSEYQVAA